MKSAANLIVFSCNVALEKLVITQYCAMYLLAFYVKPALYGGYGRESFGFIPKLYL